MNSGTMQKLALAARDVRSTLRDLERLIDDAEQAARTAENEAIDQAVHPRPKRLETLAAFQTALERLQSPNFETRLSQARARLESAMSCHQTMAASASGDDSH